MTNVHGFFGEYHFLSNFYESPFVLDGLEYQTVEHYFQACKATCEKDHEWVRSSETPGIAKHRGRRITPWQTWDKMRIGVMRKGLRAKFEQNPDLKKKLMETAFGELVESNHWGDQFWGVCNNKGYNNLGILLMELRDSFKIEQYLG